MTVCMEKMNMVEKVMRILKVVMLTGGGLLCQTKLWVGWFYVKEIV